MLKKIIGVIALVTIVGVLIFGAGNRTMAKVGNESTSLDQPRSWSNTEESLTHDDKSAGNNYQSQEKGRGFNEEQINLLPESGDGLSDSEAAGLQYMREEEKLAHDVYAFFHSLFGSQNFQNISQSESTHSESVRALIDRYGLIDPVVSEMGVFTNPDLQALYNTLIERGSQSLVEAFVVGVAIEEIDILDLQERLAQTDNKDIQQVYQNLLKGSENHLRAFVAKYQQETGEMYTPQYLSVDDFQTIVNAGTQVGDGNKSVGSGNGGYRDVGGGSGSNQGVGSGNGGYRGGRP